MVAAEDPVGPMNDAKIRTAIDMARRHEWPLIAAWGSHQFARDRAKLVASWGRFQCLKLSKDGAPWHPLYVKGDAPLIPFNT